MDSNIPYIVKADSTGNIQDWIKLNKSWMDSTLDSHGAILLRGFSIAGESEFKEAVNLLSANPLNYVYRSTPRTSLGAGVYTATEYPAGLTIPQHCENSYQREWPLRLLFFCEYPADGGGGETPLANVVNVTRRIDPAVQERFGEKQVMYIRNYRQDLDLPWQTVFQTDSKSEVETFCRTQEIAWEWTGPDSLRTRQVCQAFARHPRTGAKVWFNQAHLFHPTGLDKQTRTAMLKMFKEDDLPRNAAYGDGSPIAEADLENVRDAFRNEIVAFPWEAGDVLVVDNMLVSHGRNPYKGKRRVLVGMCDQFSPDHAPQPAILSHAGPS
jgi:alpha-ketoglutarate-dependent taurine dioxygenase